jgi:hypothetical protein
MPRWPLALIGAPAAVAVWSGWVSLAGLSGFGVVHPLPGIASGFTINSAITLPVGVEAYAAFALGAWLRPGTPDRARRFAKFSAIGSLTLGTLGQVAYHLLAAAHATRAPWPVVVLVSSLPVVVLGLASGLAHLLREADEDVSPVVTIPTPDATGETVSDADADAPEVTPAIAPVVEPVDTVYPPITSVGSTVPAARGRRSTPAAKSRAPERVFKDELERGEIPSVRETMRRLKVGAPKAREIRNELVAMLEVPEAEAAL